jgi:hypothetical protein
MNLFNNPFGAPDTSAASLGPPSSIRDHGKEWIRIDHKANIRRGNKVSKVRVSARSTPTAERSWHYAHRTLRQQAYDILSAPAMSAEREWIISSSKRLTNLYRLSLGDDIIEALECLKF